MLAFLSAVTVGHAQGVVNATIKAADGNTIAYDVRGQGDTALILLHGWCGDRAFWKHQVDVFAKDYRVVAVDQAGHGLSGKNRKDWTLASLAYDVVDLVKELKLKRVILVGHSMGGSVSLAAAKRLPGTVVGVVGVDTLQNAEFKWPEDMSKKFLAAFETDFKGTLRNSMKGMFAEKADPELVNWIITKAENQDQKMATALMHALSRTDLTNLFKQAKVPIRCINSAPGFQFAVPTAIQVNRKYSDYNAVIMEGTGHFPMLERPEEFNTKLREVLKEFAAKK
jgi:pimeloyl-ACP methyl ester carboxylesterase